MKVATEVEELPPVVFTAVDDKDVEHAWELSIGEHRVGGLAVRIDDEAVRVSTGFPWIDAVDVDVARRVIAAIEDVARAHPGLPVGVSATDALLRDELRRAGYAGALRAHLWKLPDAAPPRNLDDLAQVAALLPAVDLTAPRERGRLLSFSVRSRDTETELQVLAARRPMIAEQVAAAIDTAITVKHALAPAVSVRKLQLGIGHGASIPKVLGRAHGAGACTLDGSMVIRDDLLASRHASARRRRRTFSMRDPFCYAPVDSVTAHEVWHLVDHGIVGTGRDYVAFQRDLGEALGVDTLEHALRGRDRGAPQAWRDARAALASQVSEYAATKPRETTAEMFATWWCSQGVLPPVVARFASLVEERLGHTVSVPGREAGT